MSINFFDAPCKEPSRVNPLFGICDDQDGFSKAYTDVANSDKWIATVLNDAEKEVSFTPIDHCFTIMKEGTKNEESLCDGMLTFQNSLYLVELKEQGTGGWLPKAVDQLENTITLMSASHDLSTFKYKKAYACNKKHPFFTKIDIETRMRFFRSTKGFRLDAQARIVIK